MLPRLRCALCSSSSSSSVIISSSRALQRPQLLQLPQQQQRILCRGLLSSALQDRLGSLEERHKAVQEQLMQPELEARARTRLSRELSSLERVVQAISDYRGAQEEVAGLQSMAAEAEEQLEQQAQDEQAQGGAARAAASSSSASQELAAMARSELHDSALPALEAAEGALTRLLLPRDEVDSRDAILELRAGVGGEEAALFAADMMRLYEAHVASKGWTWTVLQVHTEEESGGVREAVVAIAGEGAFGRLKFESGVHRVQRIPKTQSTGKLQTSTMTVAVLPEAEEVDIEVRMADLRIDTYRAGGAGGQHVNTTDSAVRITHLPTGLVVAIQDERSQTQNRVKAMRVLRARLFEAQRQRIVEERSRDRMVQIGTSARSDRVRTYNFMQNRVTDHRVNISKHDIDAVMRGECLDEFVDALEAQEKEEALAHMLK
jgi:peptide chain release factor 1